MDQIRPRTGFQRWLAEYGDEVAAQRLGVPRRTVKSWRLGDRIPRPAQARQIMDRAEVTMDDIYGQPANDAPEPTGPRDATVAEATDVLLRNGATVVCRS